MDEWTCDATGLLIVIPLLFLHRGPTCYELVLKTDLYTRRHTQWFYFRVSNTQPGTSYTFRIVNLLKKESLYEKGENKMFVS